MDKTVGASFETLPITHGLVDVGDDVITTTVMTMTMVFLCFLKNCCICVENRLNLYRQQQQLNSQQQ